MVTDDYQMKKILENGHYHKNKIHLTRDNIINVKLLDIIELIKNTSNDEELGEKIREYYYKELNFS